MEQVYKLQSLQEMMDESRREFPNQADEAIEEYLSQISEEQAIILKEKLADPAYLDAFQVAISHTSFMVTLALLKTRNSEPNSEGSLFKVDFDQYIRQYLFFARQDDKTIYDMRTYYLDTLTSEEMQMTGEDEASREIAKNYDILMKNLSKQYKDSKRHIAE